MLATKYKHAFNRLIAPVAAPFVRLGVHPTAITLAGPILETLACLWLLRSRAIVPFCIISLVIGCCDGLDGVVARASGKVTKFGGYLDALSDRYFESVIAVTVASITGYWALMKFVPAPGGLAGDLSPSGNLGAWIDRTVLGEAHLWRQSRTWDPEGLLSTLPAIGTALTGVAAGVVLTSARPPAAARPLRQDNASHPSRPPPRPSTRQPQNRQELARGQKLGLAAARFLAQTYGVAVRGFCAPKREYGGCRHCTLTLPLRRDRRCRRGMLVRAAVAPPAVPEERRIFEQ